MRKIFCGPSIVATVVITATTGTAQQAEHYRDNLPVHHPAIQYELGSFDHPVASLSRSLDAGGLTLDLDGRFGYLPSLLHHLDIQLDSQVLVFSRTSLQAHLVSPRSPRAIYFSDTVAVGFVPGADVIEIAAFTSKRGTSFYTLNTARTEGPKIVRSTGCLSCHQGPATLGVPGPYVGSVSTSATGRPAFRLGTVVVDHRTPLDQRWGGWYVTGTHGTQQHRGNRPAQDPTRTASRGDDTNLNLTSLRRLLNPSRYLTPSSDIVALMTLEHQTHLINLFTRISWEAKIARHNGELDTTERNARQRGVEEIVRYMLFADEVAIDGPIQGVSSFRRTFPVHGPHDQHGRSLRDFDLRTRLFRYPLSYMIYSPLFDDLPPPVLSSVYQRLFEILTGNASTDQFGRLSALDRNAIREILSETKIGLPAYWHQQ